MPLSRISNGDEGVKTIRQLSYSPNITTADFLSFREQSQSLQTSCCPRGSLKTSRGGGGGGGLPKKKKKREG